MLVMSRFNLSPDTNGGGFPLMTEAWFFVDALDVLAPSPTRFVVAFGDTITDGIVAAIRLSLPASVSVADKNGRYPDAYNGALTQPVSRSLS
jgi:hypothetical protein